MKNLIPLSRKISFWDKIVNVKHLASRIPLQSIRAAVLRRFNAYVMHTLPNTLETITASAFVAPNIILLQGCYSKSINLSVLKTKIREKQDVLFRSECQYCNIGEPNTFDHYLPQVDFPEFSALSINLIPCCSVCNTEKGEEWLLIGQRTVLNLYFDLLPNIDFLICQITFRRAVPTVVYSLNTIVIPANLRSVVTNHYNTLKLFERYRLRSNSEISDVLNAITPSVGILTKAQIVSNLITEANSVKRDKGQNYWRAVLLLTLANSNRFLTIAGF